MSLGSNRRSAHRAKKLEADNIEMVPRHVEVDTVLTVPVRPEHKHAFVLAEQ
jgi:hypothetical protein